MLPNCAKRTNRASHECCLVVPWCRVHHPESSQTFWLPPNPFLCSEGPAREPASNENRWPEKHRHISKNTKKKKQKVANIKKKNVSCEHQRPQNYKRTRENTYNHISAGVNKLRNQYHNSQELKNVTTSSLPSHSSVLLLNIIQLEHTVDEVGGKQSLCEARAAWFFALVQ